MDEAHYLYESLLDLISFNRYAFLTIGYLVDQEVFEKDKSLV